MEANGGGDALSDNTAVANAPMGCNSALIVAFLRLPAQEIARCRTVCRGWRDATSTDAFRHRHRDHHFRTPMPLFFFLDPKLVRLNLRAVDIRDRVSRPVIAYTRPSNHELLRIHGSCAGILLLSSGLRLYACNPCTRRWAHLPPIHVKNDIIGFYVTPTATGCGEFHHVLYHDRVKFNCTYWIFRQGAAPRDRSRTLLARPTLPVHARMMANGIAPSYRIPPVFFSGFLHWPPKAAKDNINVLVFQAATGLFGLIPPPSIRVGGEDVPVLGRQVFEIDQHIAMTSISFSPPRVDVWVLGDIIPTVWTVRYSIRVPVNEIRLESSCHHNASVFAVAQDRNDLVQCPRILLQCDALGGVLGRYELADHWTSLSGSGHTLEESLLLHTAILPMQDTDAVDGDPPFFQN